MTTAQFDVLCERIGGVKEDVAVLSKWVTGNGDPNTGILTRLDRAEVKIRRATWIIKAIFCAVAAGVCGLIADLVVKAL